VTCQATLISRAELAAKAQAAGLNITVRTLRYWASVGLIPKPIYREHGKAYYPADLLHELSVIEALRRGRRVEAIKQWLKQPIIEELELGGKRFQIVANLGEFIAGNKRYVIKLTRCSAYLFSIKHEVGGRLANDLGELPEAKG